MPVLLLCFVVLSLSLPLFLSLSLFRFVLWSCVLVLGHHCTMAKVYAMYLDSSHCSMVLVCLRDGLWRGFTMDGWPMMGCAMLTSALCGWHRKLMCTLTFVPSSCCLVFFFPFFAHATVHFQSC
eukprot:m.114507 g.114507  ORF g.114507 m.114507 type:complete len:124 (-) comp10844_c0_seq4:973-1344(-)